MSKLQSHKCTFERETLRSCVKYLGCLAITTLPGASRSFNPVLPLWNRY